MERYRFGDLALTILAEHQHAAVTELVAQPGVVAPPHRHPAADEVFIGVEGALEVDIDGTTYRLGPGDVVAAPAGAAHGFCTLGETVARAYVVFAPGAFLGFFREALGRDRAEPLDAVMARWDVTPA